jgi:hypothetical protein
VRCRETAGLLFPKPCDQPAAGSCGRCGRPVCQAHVRQVENAWVCVSCVRQGLRDHNHRGTYAHLADDPYFFWYAYSADWSDPTFTGSDYALFGPESGAPDLDEDFERDWGGS